MNLLKKLSLIIILLLLNTQFYAQKTILMEQNDRYKNYRFKTEKEWDKFNNYTARKKSKSYKYTNTDLTKIVFGWNPYWMGTAYKNLDYSLLTDVSYFSYEVDPQTGLPKDLHYWKTTELVDSAHAHNCRVSLTVTLFSGHADFFASSTSKQTLIDTVIGLIKYRNADGVNLDIEAVPSDQSGPLTAFVQDFCTQFHNEFPDGQVSLDLPAVNWNDKFNVAYMVNYVDLFLIMGYDYHWSGSEEAGPNSPKNNGSIWSPYDVTRSINYYLDKGIPPEKLALAVPYYGRQWSTTGTSVPSATTGNSSAKIYSDIRKEQDNYEYHWDVDASVPYHIFQENANWYQCWYDDEYSLGYKYDLVKMKNLAGIGIWALAYDGDYPNLEEMLAEKFRQGGAKAGYGIFTDMGGPRGDYYNNEDYIFTIAPEGSTEIKLYFDEFNTESNDVLNIYDGDTTSGTIIASFSGNQNITDTITASTGIMTIHFVSDASGVASGWYARWVNNDYALKTEEINLNISGFKIYPNPSNDKLIVEINALINENILIELADYKGAMLFRKNVSVKQGINRIDLSSDISSLKNGYYFLNIKSKNYRIGKKIIIAK